MTTEEKRQRIADNCINCMFCPLHEALDFGERCWHEGADIERNYEIMFGKGESNEQSETDIQNRQEHSDG